VDPTIFSSELSRDLFYSNTNFIKFILVRDILNLANSLIYNTSLNLNSITNYLFFYLFNTNNEASNLGQNTTLFKSQFRPMKKGVTNMIRLHATSAIAMPIELRLHILASSKDIIHSWSIPSAGIKIDCVPGYSSHRIAIFLVTGIF
jgi:heme/copper-type cytochrome/quinol oxidase subunit 2